MLRDTAARPPDRLGTDAGYATPAILGELKRHFRDHGLHRSGRVGVSSAARRVAGGFGKVVGRVHLGKLGDVVVGTAGDVAGSVVDPKAGLGKLRSAITPRVVALLGGGLLLGYLVARSRRRS
ncbi:hypothetical protein [Micromonospora sp. NPDC049645]|uniref:hypothetical protein n=1 Tax=Micromonospora sp. NPDC049645 TaxID=3155508 RepID=UPI003447E0F3